LKGRATEASGKDSVEEAGLAEALELPSVRVDEEEGESDGEPWEVQLPLLVAEPWREPVSEV
jgi:hypothetical protein